jgi:hypothetical protein
MSWGVDRIGAMARNGQLSPDSESVEGPTNFLSPRQQRLDFYWRYFRCANYDGWKYDWNGSECASVEEQDVIARSGVIPPGFYNAGGTTNEIPAKFRKPLAPYYLGKVIPKRFTSMLFSAKRHPSIGSDDADTTDWLKGFAEATRLWAQAIKARDFGGGMGTVAMGFKFVDGEPIVEVFDARWCTPEFEDRTMHTLAELEYLYQYPLDVRLEDGTWEQRWFWYRRVIDRETDTVWPKVRVEQGVIPHWEEERHVKREHNFGFCPVVWVQNQPVDDDVDGDPDCFGIYDSLNEIDGLFSAASRGTKANCDPTIIVKSDAEFSEIRKGSGNAIQVGKGEDVDYAEMTGAGIDRALKIAELLEEKALTVAQCMLDRNEGGPSRTEKEIDHSYSAMVDQADILREQYGEKGIRRLLEMVLKAVRTLDRPQVEHGEDGIPRIVKQTIVLPKKKNVDPVTGKITYTERTLGEGTSVELAWPAYFSSDAQETLRKVDAAGKAVQYQIIDQETATNFVAPEFAISNVPAVLDRIKSNATEAAKAGIELFGLGDHDALRSRTFGRKG